jgi:hypothetical protein
LTPPPAAWYHCLLFFYRFLLSLPVDAACSAVNANPEPQWSGAHRGLALYVSRLLAPVWDVRIITPSANNPNVWKARLTEKTMMVRTATQSDIHIHPM